MRHFLDTSVLSACGQVFSAFDESVMFSAMERRESVAPEFKKAFRKISRMVNCVTCHRCKLHARVAFQGIGVAIKILLTRNVDMLTRALSRDEIVALVNTLHKFSESIAFANEMMERYEALGVAKEGVNEDILEKKFSSKKFELLSLVSQNGTQLTRHQRDVLVHAIVTGREEILLLAQNFSGSSFIRHSLIALGVDDVPDVIVVGGGLAGLVTAISVADRGGSVVVLEKGSTVGGNSAKASSGINSWETNAEVDGFLADTVKSQNGKGSVELAGILVNRAKSSVAWLEKVSGVDLSAIGQLGGHSRPRTHRPIQGVVGAELMAALAREIKNRWPLIRVITKATVQEVLTDKRNSTSTYVSGVKYVDGFGDRQFLFARSGVVIASGGFGYDAEGMLKSYRPDLVGFPTTLGAHTTGDGIRLAASVGADLLDMEHVQLHPTGFVDPSDRAGRTKVLAAEILRGIGGILVNRDGVRFVNELGTRKHVTDVMLKQGGENRIYYLILSEAACDLEPRMTSIYESRGLLQRVTSMRDLKAIVHENVERSLLEYDSEKEDYSFGRPEKLGLPFLTSSYWLVGEVTPVVHYTMGGVRIDVQGRVLRRDLSVVENLFAVGEVTGGVHGENRLGGNSLLECTVFGKLIGGETIELDDELAGIVPLKFLTRDGLSVSKKNNFLPKISSAELHQHSIESDCWTAIDGYVYDLSSYAEEHPGGAEPIRASCGKDATERFKNAHSVSLLKDMDFAPIGVFMFN